LKSVYSEKGAPAMHRASRGQLLQRLTEAVAVAS
jgi:hypothetical protein